MFDKAQESAAEQERRERQVAALYELWRSVPHTETGRLLQRIAERVTSALDGHTCSLLLREKGGNTLRVAASVGLPQDVADSVTLLVGERIAGRVAASGLPILVNKDPRTHPLLAQTGEASDITRRPEVESALCAPLSGADGAVHGVLCLSRFTPATPFSESDLRMFCLFAAQAGATIAQERTVEDLTRAAREAAVLEREMRQSEHLVALGQMAATVAHELRNPLSSIKAAAQFLLREAEHPNGAIALTDFLNIVVDEVNGLSQLTSELLEFARPTPPAREVRSLVSLTHAEITFLRGELERLGVSRILEEYPDDPCPVAADAAQIGQTLRNLLLNAGQATSDATPNIITVRILPEEDAYRLTLTDTGSGIAPDLLPRIWEPFFTTKARGSGLGLAQARRVLEAHGGRIDATSIVNSGTCFTLYLPRIGIPMISPAMEQEEISNTAAESSESPAFNAK